MLTIHLLTKNNEATIEPCLQSIVGIPDSQIVVADIGSDDNTIEICENYGAIVEKFDFKGNLSNIRNALLEKHQGDWHFVIEPWEAIVAMPEYEDPGIFNFQIIRGDTVSKQIRMWHSKFKLKFEHPVFESIIDNRSKNNGGIIYAENIDRCDWEMSLIEKWMEAHPTLSTPYYYKSCIHLAKREYPQFLEASQKYLFKEKDELLPVTMTRYYRAIIYTLIKKDYQNACKSILPCLIDRPMMAEFWCCLGDINYFLVKRYELAMAFYENAVILGSRRPQNDSWPIEISKYREYPEKMIASCAKIIQQSRTYVNHLPRINPQGSLGLQNSIKQT